MVQKIQFKRGLSAQIPTLDIAEPGFCTDTQELYIGSSTGNRKVTSFNEITELKADNTQRSINVKSAPYNATGDGVTDDTAALQSAIDGSYASGGGIVFLPKGIYMQSSTLTIYSNVHLLGAGERVSIIRKMTGMATDAIRTSGFSTFTGTTVVGNEVPINFSIKHITLEGNYMYEDPTSKTYTSYVNTSGGGVKIYGRRFELDCEIINMAGVGLWVEMDYTEVSPTNDTKDYVIDAEIRDTKEECFILKKLSDGRINHLWARGAGRRIESEQNDTPLVSPTYASSGYTYTDNIVFDNAGAEIGQIHSWGGFCGRGIRTVGALRVISDSIITESCIYGGVLINDGAYGEISKLKVHGCSGGKDGSIPDVEIKSTRVLNITSINQEARAANDTGQTAIHISGSFVNIAQINVNKLGLAGHGVYIDGNFNNIRGTVNNGTGVGSNGQPSAGVYRKATSRSKVYSIDFLVVNFPVAFRSDGQCDYENVKIVASVGSGQVIFSGDQKVLGTASKWMISGAENSASKSSEYYGNSLFDPTLTTEQTLTLNHTLIATPNAQNIMLSIQDSPTSFTSALSYCFVSAVDATTITVKLKMSTANGVNTSPRVNVFAFL